jgi:hypothetical protein
MLSFCIEKKRVWVVPLCMCMTGIHGFGSEWEKHKFYHNQSSTFHLILLPCIFVPFLYRLNILAELLCFGDREFYKDWWNAKTVEEYWRMWNMPVHKWVIRHIYFPCIRNGFSKGVAILISFLVSAAFHELCVAVPCHIFKFWAFIGIMFQV